MNKYFYIVEKDGEIIAEELDLSSPLLVERFGDPKYKPCKEKDKELKIKEKKDKKGVI